MCCVALQFSVVIDSYNGTSILGNS